MHALNHCLDCFGGQGGISRIRGRCAAEGSIRGRNARSRSVAGGVTFDCEPRSREVKSGETRKIKRITIAPNDRKEGVSHGACCEGRPIPANSLIIRLRSVKSNRSDAHLVSGSPHYDGWDELLETLGLRSTSHGRSLDSLPSRREASRRGFPRLGNLPFEKLARRPIHRPWSDRARNSA